MQPDAIKVLDHGYVHLVDHMGGDLSVVRAARVSYDAAWRAGEDSGSDAKLINYLWRNKHTTPFEAVTFTFEVYAPIFVFRQWHRHRTWSFNEISARYRELPEKFYVPDLDKIGVQSTNNKQGRVSVNAVEIIAMRPSEIDHYKRTCQHSFSCYQALLAAGWPRELARAVLPLATYSHMFATVNLLNLLKFLTLRCDEHAQYEIRVYADAMRELVKPIVPVCMAAFEKSIIPAGFLAAKHAAKVADGVSMACAANESRQGFRVTAQRLRSLKKTPVCSKETPCGDCPHCTAERFRL